MTEILIASCYIQLMATSHVTNPSASGPNTLYHYCGTDSFLAILRNKSVWLSSLSLSNDTMEGRLVRQAIDRLAKNDALEKRYHERLLDSVVALENTFDGLGFCLSEDGDLLSQWRGYADDARGVSIGFSRAYLEKFSQRSRESASDLEAPGFTLKKVDYDPDAHEANVEPTYRKLRKSIDAGAFKSTGQQSVLDTREAAQIAADDAEIKKLNDHVSFGILSLFSTLFELKSPAFREEQEWRMLTVHVQGFDNCKYRSTRERVIPYRIFDLPELEIPAITEVVIGPRHQTPIEVVRSMLRSNGFGNADVRLSEASYR